MARAYPSTTARIHSDHQVATVSILGGGIRRPCSLLEKSRARFRISPFGSPPAWTSSQLLLAIHYCESIELPS